MSDHEPRGLSTIGMGAQNPYLNVENQAPNARENDHSNYS